GTVGSYGTGGNGVGGTGVGGTGVGGTNVFSFVTFTGWSVSPARIVQKQPR
ncbi:hypothetical protein JGX37_16180, partial [Listeria monocytogenes]|nr:hypothetical protein [Listeria monocytogenes]MCG3330100.1 hypothetical protein [Listeria monocytogenes]